MPKTNTIRKTRTRRPKNVPEPVTYGEMYENAKVVKRTRRAAERKVWYMDTGRLPRAEAKKVVEDFMAEKAKPRIDLGDPELNQEVADYIETLKINPAPAMDVGLVQYTDGARVPGDVDFREKATSRDIVAKMAKLKALDEFEAEEAASKVTRMPASLDEVYLQESRTARLQQEFKDSARRLVQHLFVEAMTEAFSAPG